MNRLYKKPSKNFAKENNTSANTYAEYFASFKTHLISNLEKKNITGKVYRFGCIASNGTGNISIEKMLLLAKSL